MQTWKKIVFITISIVVFTVPLGAQEKLETPGLSLTLSPFLGYQVIDAEAVSNLGFGASLGIRYTFKNLPMLCLQGTFDYTNNGLEPVDNSASIINFGAGVRGQFGLTPKIAMSAHLDGGYFMATTKGYEAEGNPYIRGGVGAYFNFTPTVSLNADISYRQLAGLYGDVQIAVGVAYHLGKRQPRSVVPGNQIQLYDGLSVEDAEFAELYPVFYASYEDEPLGRGTLINESDSDIEHLELTVYIQDYMDSPQECVVPDLIAPGEEVAFDIYALFNNQILNITAPTRASVQFGLEFSVDGTRYKDSATETIRIKDRNAIQWDDDRRVAAFISNTDPMVLQFAKNISSMTKGQGSKAIDKNFLTAISLHNSLKLLDLQYSIDPSSSYANLSDNSDAVDFCLYPSQTLVFKAGDCDDLTILYASLFESLGIETAFITVPGHILMAFALDMEPSQAKRQFGEGEFLDLGDGRAWIPIEATATEENFLQAWQKGVDQWHSANQDNEARLYPTREAWTVYRPVHLPEQNEFTDLPYDYEVLTAFLQDVIAFIDQKILTQSQPIQEAILANRNNPNRAAKAINRLGVLYAIYGRYGEAEDQFQRAIDTAGETASVVINLGNIYFLKEDYGRALSYYERATRLQPENTRALLATIRTQKELGMDRDARRTFAALEDVDPTVAEHYAYLEKDGETSRASDMSGAVDLDIWLDE